MAPASETELAEAISAANAPMSIRGGGTRLQAPPDGTPLTTSGLTGITLYEPGALTLVARAGTPLSEIITALEAEGQRLPFEPPNMRNLLGTEGTPTIGGVFAANASGPRRINGGAARDYLLGVRFVDGAGQVIKNGGRVMKNVTGYDLVKLMAGSWGTLGVLTEVSLKVLARPEAEATLIARGMDPVQGVAALSAALGSPFDVSGAAHLGAGVAGVARTQVRVEGMSGSVIYRCGRLLELLPGFEVIEGGASAALWEEVRDVAPFAGRKGAVWRVSVKPGDGPVLSDALLTAGVDHAAIFDWGGGLVWLLTDETNDAGAASIRQQIVALGGHATLVRGGEALRGRVPMFQPQPAPLAAISRGLRDRFDPRGILNPGLMG
ncbi:FAD-binding protein [Pseudoruegeria sp. HB172150]|uniref:FAD-binding protein n=1 Tax=Pseudoruegeria sp. HB172150 TaxID=2721164 RepID=UPI0015551D7A